MTPDAQRPGPSPDPGRQEQPAVNQGNATSGVRAGAALERPQSAPDLDPTGLKSHSLAELIPEMSEEEFVALKGDISTRGLLEPVVVYEAKILDGRHRLRACVELGITPTAARFMGQDPLGFVVAKNLHRRHLTRQQRRELVVAVLHHQLEKSDRQVARTVGVSPTTVGAVRADLEERGDVSKLDTRIDTLGRTQPATKTTAPFEDQEDRANSLVMADATKEEFEEALAKARDELDLSQGNVVAHIQGRRRPLPEAFLVAVVDLGRMARRVEQLVADDRFPANRERLREVHGSDLERARMSIDKAIAALEAM